MSAISKGILGSFLLCLAGMNLYWLGLSVTATILFFFAGVLLATALDD